MEYESAQLEKIEDAILATPEVSRRLIGKKIDGLETAHRYLIVYGSEVFGYIASYEEWSAKFPRGLVFNEVRFQTSIFATPADAEADARLSARAEAKTDGYKLSRWQRFNPAWPSAFADKKNGCAKERSSVRRARFATVTGYSSPARLVEALESGVVTIQKIASSAVAINNADIDLVDAIQWLTDTIEVFYHEPTSRQLNINRLIQWLKQQET